MTPKEIKDIIPIDKVYEDAVRPAMKQIGLALESVARTSRFLLAPIDYLAAQHTRWEKYLTRVVDKVDEANLIEGQAQMVIPTLEGLSLAPENSLICELFINLLSVSIDQTKQEFAHPAFPNIIGQLSRDEAVILFYLKHNVQVVNYFNSPPTPKERIVFQGDVLQFPKMCDMYKHHLNNLSLTFYNRANDHCLTALGGLFVKACVPDSFAALEVPEFNQAIKKD